MKTETLAPEEIELQKKRLVLERIKDRLADREEEMADLRGRLERFEARYTMEVGRLYAEQDEIDAQIAEEEVKLVPDDEEIKKKAEELRRRAEESAARAQAELEADSAQIPTAEAKKAYHNIARIIHPDLALDQAEKDKRHGLMAQLNAAYSSGDQSELDRLVESYRNSPELIAGDSLADDLVRSIRQIYQVNARIRELSGEKQKAEASELFGLLGKVEAESDAGRDLLKQMAERARTHIKKSARRLENLQNVNLAAEEYVKEKFGMDIGDFRKSRQ
ncbi:MAG: hypothetical protein ABI539_02915 [Acidobacteriota bacterium]